MSDLSQTTKLSSISRVLLLEKLSIRRCKPASIGARGRHFSQLTAKVDLRTMSTTLKTKKAAAAATTPQPDQRPYHSTAIIAAEAAVVAMRFCPRRSAATWTIAGIIARNRGARQRMSSHELDRKT